MTLLQVRKQKHSYFLESCIFFYGYSLFWKWFLFLCCIIGEAFRCVHEWNGPIACLIPLRWAFQTFFPISVSKIVRAYYTSFERNLQSRKIFLGSPLVWATPQTEPGDLLVFWRSSLHWMIVRWTQSPNSNSRCLFLLNPVNLNFFQMDVVDPVEVGLEDIGGPAAAPSQGVATVAFSHNQVENWGRLMRFPV